MPSTSIQAMPLSPNPTMHEPRTRPSASHPQTAAPAASGSSSSLPSASTSASADALTSTARPSFNLRDFMVDDDADQASLSMFKFMDEEAIIRAQVEALKVLNDAALSRALRESEETAVQEEKRRKQQLKQEELAPDSAETSPLGSSAAMNSSPPVMDQLKREAPPRPPPLRPQDPDVHCRSDEAAARSLAREWKVASLQGALLENPDMLPLLSPTQPTTTSFTSSSSSAAAAARKVILSSSARPTPITIPAKEFYSRSPPQAHHRQGSTSRSSTSSKSSPPQTPFVAPDPKDKSQTRLYTSASSVAAAQAAAKDKTRTSPTKPSFGPIYASSSQSQQTPLTQAPSVPPVKASHKSKRASAEIAPLPRKSASPERARTTNVPAAATSALEHGVNLGQKAHTSTSSNVSGVPQLQTMPKVSTVAEGPRSMPGVSPGSTTLPSGTPQTSTVMTSASKVAAAAEKEKARSKQASASASTPASTSTSTSASTTASRASSTSRPASREAPTSLASSVPLPSPQSPSPVLAPAKPVPAAVRASIPAPDGEPASSQTSQKECEKSMVVPVSSLSDPEGDADDSDVEDSNDSDDDEEEEEEKEEEKDNNTESIPFRYLYTANRSCSKCGESILSPRKTLIMPADPFSFPFIELLHISCTSCGALHCRGCSSLAKCPKSCLGSKSCSVKDCCPQVCAIAIFEALSTFDQEFSKEAGLFWIQKSTRDEFIQTMISRPTPQMKKLELTFLRTMRTLTTLFQSSRGIHPTVGEIFERSLMPEIIHGFLRSTNVRDWIAHSDTYCAILTLLRYMVEGGSGDVMTAPLRRIETSCGLKDWMWGKGTIVWASGEDDIGPSKEDHRDRETYKGELKGGAEKPVEKGEHEKTIQCASTAPLGSLMKQLEAHRRPLLALAAKVQFPATVEKVNGLCDGISYLVLQQVLGSI